MGLNLRHGPLAHPMFSLINFGLRACQFLLAIAALGLSAKSLAYAKTMQNNDGGSAEWASVAKTTTAIVASVLSIVTALVSGFLPPVTADFYYIAVSCWWDFIIFCLWIASFAFFRQSAYYLGGDTPEQYISSAGSFFPTGGLAELYRMRDAVWIDLAELLLWFSTSMLGLAGLCIGRSGSRRGAAV